MKTRQAQKTRRFDSLEQEAFLGLWRTYDRLKALEDDLFARYDLTSQQYNVLRLLKAEYPGAVRTLDLAARLVSRAPDITRMLDKLEHRLLVSRDRPAANRRVVQVGVTEAGLELMTEMHESLRECHTNQLGHLSRKDLETLIALLRTARLPHEETDSTWR